MNKNLRIDKYKVFKTGKKHPFEFKILQINDMIIYFTLIEHNEDFNTTLYKGVNLNYGPTNLLDHFSWHPYYLLEEHIERETLKALQVVK